MEIRTHFGVYGVASNENKILVIKKNAGPYQNRYDLPGGSQEKGEGLTETLVREIFEETGYSVKSYRNPRVYDAIVKEYDKDFAVHHIMVFYDFEIDSTSPQTSIPKDVIDGKNDSDYTLWIDIQKININNASPVLLKIKQERMGRPELDKTVFKCWEVI